MVPDKLGVAAVNCRGKIANRTRVLANEAKIPSCVVPGIDCRYPRLGEFFKFVGSCQPTLQVALWQIGVRVVANEIRRKQSSQMPDVNRRVVFALSLTKLHHV